MSDQDSIVATWPRTAHVDGDSERGSAVSTAADIERRRGYEGDRNTNGGAGENSTDLVSESVANPATMLDRHDSLPVAKARRWAPVFRNPNIIDGGPPQSGRGYVRVAEAGAHLAAYQSGVSHSGFETRAYRPTPVTLDGESVGD